MENVPIEEQQTEDVKGSPEEESHKPRDARRPALTINIHSWATPIVGIIALLLGLLGGYFIRPLIAEEETVQAAPTTAAAQAGNTEEQRANLMQEVVSKTRHFKGSADAPVTIIEFSDFQ